jgi:hypothetical protein
VSPTHPTVSPLRSGAWSHQLAQRGHLRHASFSSALGRRRRSDAACLVALRIGSYGTFLAGSGVSRARTAAGTGHLSLSCASTAAGAASGFPPRPSIRPPPSWFRGCCLIQVVPMRRYLVVRLLCASRAGGLIQGSSWVRTESYCLTLAMFAA